MGKVPTGVKVMSILGIIFGGLGVACMPCSVAMTFGNFQGPNPLTDPLKHNIAYMTLTVCSNILSFALAGFLLTSSIGSLKLLSWGRKGMLAFAWSAMAYDLIQIVLGAVITLPLMMASAAHDPALPADGPRLIQIGFVGGSAIGLIVTAVFSGLIIYFFTRPVAVNAFKGIFPVDPAGFPVQHPKQQPPDSPFP